MSREILNLINIQKKYDDGFVAIKNFNLKINKSEFVTLLGPSGCGKTTLLKIIGGFEQTTKGKILYNGIDIKDMSIIDRPTSTVFQDYALFPNMTVEDNIKYGLRLMRTNLENVPANLVEQAQKTYNDCLKKANKEKKEIEKRKITLSRALKNLDKKYEKNEYLLSIKDMRKPEYLAQLNYLYSELEKDPNYVEKITLKEKFYDFINQILSFFKSKKTINISLRNKNPIEKEILKLKKWYRFKQSIDYKYDKLSDKLNDLDYWVSYWDTYPQIKKEHFEKRNVTRRLNKQEIEERFKRVINLIGLENKEKSYPSDLSGGMQQRVALARSIVIEPEIILLDEPLSALDAKVRQQLQNELKRLHKELGITFILVTHDQEEALMLSDKIVVMSNGEIEQIGTPEEIYDTPCNLWVANFIGKANIYKLNEITNNFNIGDYCFNLDFQVEPDKDIYFLVRPEDFCIVENNKGQINNVYVKTVNYTGLFYDVNCVYQNVDINIKSITNIEQGIYIGINLNTNNIHIIYEPK